MSDPDRAVRSFRPLEDDLKDLHRQLADLRDTVSQLQGMVMAQGDELRQLRERLEGGR